MFKHGFPPEWSTFKKLIWLVGSGIAGASYIWKTVTGTLIHITDALASPMRKCEVALEPIQDLHGQDAPYPAGGGSNKWDEEWEVGRYDLSNGVKVTSSGQIRCKNLIPVVPSSSYYIYTPTNDYIWFLFFDENQAVLSTGLPSNYKQTSGNGRAFAKQAITMPSNCYYIAFYTQTAYGSTYNNDIAVNYPSSITTYSPYSNICPITGWTGCGMTRTGKNLFDKTAYTKQGWFLWVANPFRKLEIGQTVSFSVEKIDSEEHGFSITVNNTPGGTTVATFASYTFGNTTLTATVLISQVVKDAPYFQLNGNWSGLTSDILSNAHFQIEFGDVSSYEPYSGTALPVTFPDGQTVYGGKYEFVSGVGTDDYLTYVLTGDESWNASHNGKFYYLDSNIDPSTVKFPLNISTAVDGLCEFAKAFSYDDVYSGRKTGFAIVSVTGYSYTRIVISTSIYEQISTLTGKKFLLPKANPTTITGTPQPISTLRGENNVWSNSNGDTTIIYKAQAS